MNSQSANSSKRKASGNSVTSAEDDVNKKTKQEPIILTTRFEIGLKEQTLLKSLFRIETDILKSERSEPSSEESNDTDRPEEVPADLFILYDLNSKIKRMMDANLGLATTVAQFCDRTEIITIEKNLTEIMRASVEAMIETHFAHIKSTEKDRKGLLEPIGAQDNEEQKRVRAKATIMKDIAEMRHKSVKDELRRLIAEAKDFVAGQELFEKAGV